LKSDVRQVVSGVLAILLKLALYNKI